MITTLPLCTHYWVPKALVLFVLALFLQRGRGRTRWEKQQQPAKPSAEKEGSLNGWAERRHIFQGLGAASFLVGKRLGEVSLGSRGGLCCVFVRACLAVCRRGISALSQSPERSHSGDNEKWHFHKVERKCIVSLAC